MASTGGQADAEAPSVSPPSSSGPTISLHILSPSTTEIPHLLSFTIPATATLLELKHLIQNAVPSKPALDRQRLIHRGHLLVKDTDNMIDVFGQEAIDDPSPKNLHLVLRPTTSEPVNFNRPLENPSLRPVLPVPRMSSRSSSRTNSPSRAQDSEHAPFREVIDHNPHIHQPHHRLYNNAALPPSALAPQFQTLLNNPVAAALAQNHAQVQMQQPSGVPGQPLPLHGTNNPFIVQGANPSTQPTFQQLVAQQQQARAASGMHGVPNNADETRRATEPTHGSQQPNHAPPGQGAAPNPLLQPRTNTVVREGQGPNGERWNITINETTAAIPNILAGLGQAGQPGQLHHNPIPGLDTIFGGLAGLPNRPPTARHGSHQHGVPTHQGPFFGPQVQPQVPNIWSQQRSPSPLQGINQIEGQRLSDMIMTLHHRLARLENSLARGDAPSETDITHVRSQQASFPNQLHMLESVFNRRILDLAQRSEQVRNTRQANREMLAASQRDSSPSAQPMRQSVSAPPTEAPTEGAPTSVYLLASPTGPQAILFSPSGAYASPPPFGAPNPQFAYQYLNPVEDPRIIQQRALRQMQLREQLRNLQQPPHPPPNAPQAQPQVQQQAQPQHHHHHRPQQPNGANLLARIFMPLGGPLWLILRILGVAYFFIGDGGWRRTMLVLIAALIFFIHQTGLFTNLQHLIWDPIRRHLDGILPLPNNDANPPAAAGGAAAPAGTVAPAPARPATVDAQDQAEPDPQAAADRLIRERQERDRGAVQGFGRRIERALILFIASLVPGIGERHVAAQEEAEAIRLAAVAEATESEQREREEREREAAENEGENEADGDNGVSGGHKSEGSSGSGSSGEHSTPSTGTGGMSESVDALPADEYHQHHERQHPVPEESEQQPSVAEEAEERLIDI